MVEIKVTVGQPKADIRVVPTASALLIRELGEEYYVRARTKKKDEKEDRALVHKGNLTFD